MLNRLQNKSSIVIAVVLLSSILFAAFTAAFTTQKSSAAFTSVQAKHQISASIPLGIDGDPQTFLHGIPWVRLGYPSCDLGNLSGETLKNTIQTFHSKGYHVLLIICQPRPSQLFDTQLLNDAAQGGADVVQCGNEEMNYDPTFTNYVTPQNFAKFFDLCRNAVQTVAHEIPVILGALDPHVGWLDYAQLMKQVRYLDEMQRAMNTKVHPGGHWSWRTQTLGLIDSWHNGYPHRWFSSLLGLFVFWAYQFHVDLNSGDLGKHLWVVEGTGCFKGCGLENNRQVAIAHIITLIDDVQNAIRYKVPFFYFSEKDFYLRGVLWPMGILDFKGNNKPLRQDLPMGARTLVMTCSNASTTAKKNQVRVTDQLQLMATMYAGCTLPENYYSILTR